jgi:predicted Zn-dependent protease
MSSTLRLLLAIALLLAPPLRAQTPKTGAPDPQAAIQREIDRGHAAEALDQLKASPANSPGVHLLQGKALYALDRLAEADTAFAAALTDDPHDQEAAQLRGLTLFRLGKPAAAIPLLTASHQWAPTTRVDPSYVLALCYLDTRRYDDARHAFAAQYGFPPDSAPAYLLAARMLLRREYLPVAKDFAEKAAALDPQLPLTHALLGEIALAGNHLDDAIAEFERERTRNPLDGNLYDRLGDAYSRAARYPEALQALQRAVLLEPSTTAPFILLGKVLLKQQAPASALQYLERARVMDPANFMTHSLLGQAYRALGRTEDATRETQLSTRLQAESEPRLAPAQ